MANPEHVEIVKQGPQGCRAIQFFTLDKSAVGR